MSHVHRFYVPPEECGADEVRLPPEEAHHALHVVRARVGDPAIVLDGCGRELLGTVDHVTRRDVTITVTEERRTPAPAKRLTLLQAWLHRDKPLEEVLRRGTELGVASFLFFRAERSERTPRVNQRLHRVAVEACKQCGRTWLPTFDVAQDLESAVDTGPGKLLILSNDREPVPLADAVGGEQIGLIVGPEGDFSRPELNLALERGALPISLGPATFRSEVAAALAAGLILYEWDLLAT
jgi:16S rRNA (uracil1498-N3)-methyltransferase